jgi:DNA-directed RNA polymerase specialized sigma24 family protein
MWRDGAMTETTPLQRLSEHVALRAHSTEAQRLAERIAPSTAAGGELLDLCALIARRDADGRPAIVVQERLARAAPSEPLAALALLSMLRDDLEVVRDRLVRSGRVSALDGETDTLAAAWEVVTRRPPPSRWERGDAIWNLARRVTRMRRACSAPTEPLPEDFDTAIDNSAECGSDWPGRSPALLAAAVAAGVLSPREVVLIAATRLEGRSVREVAQSLGRPYGAAKKERQRAEAALRRFAGRYNSGDPS